MRRPAVQLVAALAAFQVMAAAGTRTSLRGSRPASHRNGNITLRKRLHVNTLITEPGTGEVDWSSFYSISSGNFTRPSALKYTPAGQRILWGRTEYSAAFDVLENTAAGGGRITQFSQAVHGQNHNPGTFSGKHRYGLAPTRLRLHPCATDRMEPGAERSGGS